jgi:uncharacterized protein
MRERRDPPQSSIRHATRLAALGVAVIMALACSIGTPDDGPGTGPTAESEQPSVNEFKQDVGSTVETVEKYWGDRFTRARRQFTPVRQIVAYAAEGEVACGGQPIPRNNAVYCSDGDFIAYDVNFAVRAFTRIGDAFVYYLLGHEYAHAIQVRLGLGYSFTIEQELQADCMAGAYLGDSIRAKTLTLEPGDLEEFQQGLLAVGDDPGTPWFAPGAHGTAQQRTAAFFSGYRDGLTPCGNTAALLGA